MCPTTPAHLAYHTNAPQKMFASTVIAEFNENAVTQQSGLKVDDKILEVDGIDEIYIGLNDLHIGLGLDFMFETLSGGLIDYMAEKIKAKGITPMAYCASDSNLLYQVIINSLSSGKSFINKSIK